MDNSVIICNNSSPSSTLKNGRVLRKRKTKQMCSDVQITRKKISKYDSPLKNSHERVENVSLLSPVKCLTECNSQVKKRKSLIGVKKQNKRLLEDTIIILSDNESSINNAATRKNVKKRKRSTSRNDSCCLLISDSDDSDSPQVLPTLSEEIKRKHPRRAQDDIVVLWSSKETTPDSTLFIVDREPDPTNLAILSENNHTAANLKTNKCKTQQMTEDRKKLSANATVTKKVPPRTCQSVSVKRMRRKIHKSQMKKKKWKRNNNNERSNSENIAKTIVSEDENSKQTSASLREIIVDGCNVATMEGNGKIFSEARLKLVIDYFKKRGHCVRAFVPQHKRSFSRPLLEKLHKEGTVVFTPSRQVDGKHITPYDDRLILEYAALSEGIVVSSDQYRDLYNEKPEWRDTIKNRLLQPTFVGDYVLFPEDPLGRHGPTLDQFLRR